MFDGPDWKYGLEVQFAQKSVSLDTLSAEKKLIQCKWQKKPAWRKSDLIWSVHDDIGDMEVVAEPIKREADIDIFVKSKKGIYSPPLGA